MVIVTFANKSYKMKSSEDIDQDNMEVLKAKIRVIKGVDLYDPIQVAKICLVLNVIVPKKL